MKTPLLTFILLLGGLHWAVAQNERGWRGGSASTLTGKTFVLSLYVAPPSHLWSKNSKQNIFRKQKKAQKWLVKEASKYKSTIAFEEKALGWDVDIISDRIVGFEDEGYSEWVETLFSKTEFKSTEQFGQWVKENTQCSNYLFIIYVNQMGRSYAQPRRFHQGLYTEGCVVYYKRTNGDEQITATIAHEILHLFGAWDLYKDYVMNREEENLAAMYFPKDIMLHEDYFESNCNIDKLTAWLVGLSNSYEDWYVNFDPNKR